MNRKLGRKPRKFDKRIPRARDLIKLMDFNVPACVDYSSAMPDDLGEMLNDSLGDCTCAAYYHARQVWTADDDGDGMETASDSDVLALYEGACDYRPGNSSTDQGGVEQDVLAYLLNTGAPVTGGVDKLVAYVEVDKRDQAALKRVIYDCGIAYIGVDVPQSVMDNADDNTIPWDIVGNTQIVGGHAVILVGYDFETFTCISWGKRYKITNAFLIAHLDEAYALIDKSWIESTGDTPFGMTLEDLETAMQGLKYAD